MNGSRGAYNQRNMVLTGMDLTRPRSDLMRAGAVVAGSARSHNDFPTAMGYCVWLGRAAVMAQANPLLFKYKNN